MKLADPSSLPAGMLAIMFTDIEDSTSRWEADPAAMRRAMGFHDQLLSDTIDDHHGLIFKSTGDGVAAVFHSVDDAARAAIDIQCRGQAEAWPQVDRLKIRIGVHMGEIAPTGSDYYGPPVNRAARVTDVANGDQIAVSGLVGRFLRAASTRRMGEHVLKGIGTETIELITDDRLLADDRPLRTRVTTAVKPLPPADVELIGRTDQADRVAGLVKAHQTVTVIGPGGVGKTQFTLAVARQVEGSFDDGAVFCDLTNVADQGSALDVVAEAIGARLQPNMSLSESVVNFLEDRAMLLVLDGCEYALDAIRSLSQLLDALPDVHVLAASRERVGVRREQIYPLTPLNPATSGVELFVERAQERDFGFEPTSADRTVIVEVCERLDGMPLAIELAAAWASVLSPAELLERIDDRFAILDQSPSAGHRQTLRETVQWSHDQLDQVQAELFDRLSVFSGGFTLDAASAVCNSDGLVDQSGLLDVLRALVEKSMIASERGTGQIRFRMLGTLRQFGQERLAAAGVLDQVRADHAEYFLALAQAEAERLVSRYEAEVWDRLDREWANIRLAFATLVAADRVDAATDLVVDLGWYAGMAMRFELFRWVEDLTEIDGVEDRPHAASLFGLLALHRYFTVAGGVVETANRGLAIDQSDPHGYCRVSLAAESLNNVHSAQESDERTMAWLDSLTDDTPAMARLWALGMRVFHVCTNAPSHEAGERHAEMELIARTSGSATAAALAGWAGGMIASFESIDAALGEWRKGLDAARSISDVHLLVHLVVGLELHFTASRGDLDTVLERCLTILTDAHDQHYLAGTSHLFGVTAIILARVEQADTGAALLGSMMANGHLPRGNAVRAIDKALGERAESARAAGSSLSINEAAAVASEVLGEVIETRRRRSMHV